MEFEDTKNPWARMALACLAVILVTALAVDAAVTRLKAIHVSPLIIKPDTLMEASIELSIPAPPGGVTIKLDHVLHCRCSDRPALQGQPATVYLPKEIFIPTGKTTGIIDIDVVDVQVPTKLIITASLRSSQQTATVHLMPK